MSEDKINGNAWAAAKAHSNFGFPALEPEFFTTEFRTLEAAVAIAFSGLAENQTMFNMFLEEAEAWKLRWEAGDV